MLYLIGGSLLTLVNLFIQPTGFTKPNGSPISYPKVLLSKRFLLSKGFFLSNEIHQITRSFLVPGFTLLVFLLQVFQH